MQAVSFKSKLLFPLLLQQGLVGVHATGSVLYYKLQPVVWIALEDGNTEKGITYAHEGQSAGMG